MVPKYLYMRNEYLNIIKEHFFHIKKVPNVPKKLYMRKRIFIFHDQTVAVLQRSAKDRMGFFKEISKKVPGKSLIILKFMQIIFIIINFKY